MWLVVLRIAGAESKEYVLQPGSTNIGRDQDNDIFINDPASSREHALITYNDKEEIVTLYDLESTNGTFVNQQKLSAPYRLKSGDRIRIGSSLLVIKKYAKNGDKQSGRDHSSYTRELLSQAVDYHTALMYEVAQKLNEVADIPDALRKVSALMEVAMGAEKCEIVQAANFDNLEDFQIPAFIAQQMLDTKSGIVFPDRSKKYSSDQDTTMQTGRIRSALCVPVILEKEIIALIYLEKAKVESRDFDRDDLHLVVAISHQIALTVNRMNLIEQLSEETKIRQTLLRFVSPQETEFLLKDGLSVGQLPGLSNQSATILFADISSSTRLAEKLGAQEFGEILNKFYLDVTEIIFKFNGIVRYLGDGVMAIFLSRGAKSLNSKVAINTGLEILRYIEASQIPVTIGVTIKSGEVVVGYVGNADRVEFTVLGDSVNVAHGMQSYARPNRLIVGAEIVESIQGAKEYNIREIPPIKLKNRNGLVEVFEILEKNTVGVDTIPVARMRKGTSELIRMLPQRMSGDILSSK